MIENENNNNISLDKFQESIKRKEKENRLLDNKQMNLEQYMNNANIIYNKNLNINQQLKEFKEQKADFDLEEERDNLKLQIQGIEALQNKNNEEKKSIEEKIAALPKSEQYDAFCLNINDHLQKGDNIKYLFNQEQYTVGDNLAKYIADQVLQRKKKKILAFLDGVFDENGECRYNKDSNVAKVVSAIEEKNPRIIQKAKNQAQGKKEKKNFWPESNWKRFFVVLSVLTVLPAIIRAVYHKAYNKGVDEHNGEIDKEKDDKKKQDFNFLVPVQKPKKPRKVEILEYRSGHSSFSSMKSTQSSQQEKRNTNQNEI